MSSRAFRRLNADADVIRISENVEGDEEAEEGPGFVSVACKNKGPVVNPFSLVGHCRSEQALVVVCVCVQLNESDDAEDESEDREEERKAATSVVSVVSYVCEVYCVLVCFWGPFSFRDRFKSLMCV